MNHFSEMEWNSSKWDWENMVAFGSKASESPKKLQLADWMIVDDGEIDAGCFNPSAGGGNSGVSSAKSSISASTDSSNKDGMKGPNFKLMTFEGFTGDKMEVKGAEASLKEVPVEPLIGLKLGKCTYFESSSGGGTVKSAATLKKNKSGVQNLPAPRCLVEGCNVDLSSAKEYHRKHRVCDGHSKSSKVIVGGLERRFCQQCSRFHGLGEFDEKKRSCRRRLSDHNARRRKPPQETIHFNSTRLSSKFYEGRQQMSYLLSSVPYVHSRNPDNTVSVWNNMCNSKFTITEGYSPKCNIDESSGGHGIELPNIIDMQDNPPNGFLASKSSVPEALSPGSKGSLLSPPNLHAAAPEYRRALSLLSSNSWGSCEPESMPVHDNVTQLPSMHTIPEGVSSDFWLSGHQLPTASNFQEIQLFKTPNEAAFYSNILN